MITKIFCFFSMINLPYGECKSVVLFCSFYPFLVVVITHLSRFKGSRVIKYGCKCTYFMFSLLLLFLFFLQKTMCLPEKCNKFLHFSWQMLKKGKK